MNMQRTVSVAEGRVGGVGARAGGSPKWIEKKLLTVCELIAQDLLAQFASKYVLTVLFALGYPLSPVEEQNCAMPPRAL